MSGTRRHFLKVVASQGALAATVSVLPGCVSTLDPAPLVETVQQSGLVILSPRLYPDLMREGGALLVRSSGTEPVIRVMGEGDDRILVEEVVDHIVSALGHAAAA